MVIARVALACAVCVSTGHANAQAAAPGERCVPAGQWVVPGQLSDSALATAAIVDRAGSARVVLLGEQHDNADHHRWQLHMLAALYARQPAMVIGFEMFPRRAQPVLDRWVAGELSEAQFLAASEWRAVWRFDPQLYLPLFHFARLHRVPMVALNVDRKLTRSVAERGWDATPEADREGVSTPAAPSAAYRAWLEGIWREHMPKGPAPVDIASPAFARFVESQLVWDRAMAEALASASRRPGVALVVGIIGAGHVARGFGVPHQLRALGIEHTQSLLPWNREEACDELVAGYADAVYGVPAAPADPVQSRPRLGILLDVKGGEVVATKVEPAGIAAVAGMQNGDVLLEVAGLPAKTQADVIDAVRRQAPGTWLPIRVRRGERGLDFVAKFPPAMP